MRTLLVLVGMQGSGKTTALKTVVNALVLKPSTTRAKRKNEGDDYYFEKSWDDTLFAWKIERGGFNYGMRMAELEKISSVGITVFDPAKLEELAKTKSHLDFEIITVGVDTIETIEIQKARVNNDANRLISDAHDFEAQHLAVRDCDVVLQGKEQIVADALNAIITIVGGRGGLLHDHAIGTLIKAGVLLENADLGKIESASYDLRLADMYWCQGNYITLSEQKPTAEIPPYSYVLVHAVEHAVLPRFLAAEFDTTVSLFINGVILSNGPQVDPGYKGALFCMLYNASDTPMGISRNQHFATIQFTTTVGGAGGYKDHYQGKVLFQDFLDGRGSKSPGGKILQRLEDVKKDLKSDVTVWRNSALTLTAIAVALCGVAGGYAYNSGKNASEAAQKSAEAMEKATDATAKLELQLINLNNISKKIPARTSDTSQSKIILKKKVSASEQPVERVK